MIGDLADYDTTRLSGEFHRRRDVRAASAGIGSGAVVYVCV